MKNAIIVLSLLALVSCENKSFQNLGEINYLKSSESCNDHSTEYWLMDMKCTDKKDSVLFDSKTIGRKFELNISNVDTGSDLFHLLADLCVGDSIYLEMPATDFYTSMRGVTPKGMEGKRIKLWANMNDKLNDVQYQTHKQMFEKESINKYVERFRWNAVYDSTTGIYYEKLKQSRGVGSNFQKAKIKYVMKTINDELIAYSKEDDPLVYDKNDKSMLKGIRYVANLLKENESIRAIIPSSMAFGAQGNEKVPGHFPIIVELEMLETIQ